jgi:hypothetical protein
MAGLVPAIHVFVLDRTKMWMSGATRHQAGQDRLVMAHWVEFSDDG